MNRKFLFVNGIFAANSPTSWQVQACAMGKQMDPTNTYDEDYYLSGWLRWDQDGKAETCAQKIIQLGITDLVSHSNGGDIIRLALLKHPEIRVRNLWMIASATDRDFSTNGFNQMLMPDSQGIRRVEKITCFVSSGDMVIFNNWTSPWWWNRDLGRKGPKNVDPSVKDRVAVIEDDTQGHFDWVDKNLLRTLSTIMKG